MKHEVMGYFEYKNQLTRIFLWFLLGLVCFLLGMATAETYGLSREWIGVAFLFASITLYAIIGIFCRTSDMQEYYVAGRRIPSFYNGMATAADWMSAASFLSLAGGLYLQGFSGNHGEPGGLAYVMGWAGGFVLLAIWVVPELRAMNLYTLPEYFGRRYGQAARTLAAWGAIICSFTYVVAQIYGVGLITSRLTGVQFEIGIMLGLGGVLICSFLGGMRAITWTQVAQYVILLLAFLIPVSWLAYKQLGTPVSAIAPLVYGQQLAKISQLEQNLLSSDTEFSARQKYTTQARILESRISTVELSLAADVAAATDKLNQLKDSAADISEIQAANRALAALPKTTEEARSRWSAELRVAQQRAMPLGGLPPNAQLFDGAPDGTALEASQFHNSRINFIALMICLMAGTMGLPHVVTRYYTTPTVASARRSVAWSLFFISLLYISVPAMAVLVKYEVMQNLVGNSFNNLPAWISQWSRIDPNLIVINDINGDGILQFAELYLGADIIMLLTPELGGLPYVISGLVAAGGLAAALSTADGLLLTIGNAFAYDLRYSKDSALGLAGNEALHRKRVMASKLTLLVVAIFAALLASFKPSDILRIVAASFSLAAAIFVPSLLFGIYSKRSNAIAAVLAMLLGSLVTVYYMLSNTVMFRQWMGWVSDGGLWFNIHPISAGVFGLATGIGCHILFQFRKPTTPKAAPFSEPLG